MLAFGLKGPGVAPSCRKTFSFVLLETASVETGVSVRSNRTSQHFGRCISVACLNVKEREEERGRERYSKRKDDKEVAEDGKCTQI
jgi:hypothetical protein